MERSTNLGSLKINKEIFVKIINEALEKVKGDVNISNRDSKILKKHFSKAIYIDDGEDIKMEFFIITKFGKSIKELTDILFDTIISEISLILPKSKIMIRIHVVGVKSKNIAKKDIILERVYEP